MYTVNRIDTLPRTTIAGRRKGFVSDYARADDEVCQKKKSCVSDLFLKNMRGGPVGPNGAGEKDSSRISIARDPAWNLSFGGRVTRRFHTHRERKRQFAGPQRLLRSSINEGLQMGGAVSTGGARYCIRFGATHWLWPVAACRVSSGVTKPLTSPALVIS